MSKVTDPVHVRLPQAIQGATEIPIFRFSDYSLKKGDQIVIDDGDDGYTFDVTDLVPRIENAENFMVMLCTRLTRLNVEGFRYVRKDVVWSPGDLTTETLFPCKIKKIYIKIV